MKPRLFLILGLALGLTAFGSAFAQMTTDSTDKLDAAVALLNAGKPKEARAVLATVGENDPKRAIAKGYDALCLYQLDKLKFIKSISTAEMQAAQLPEGLREELDYRQIDTLLFYRKFEELLPKTVEFAQRHADSPRAETMAEYQMAALYERGMKNLGDAAFTRARKGDKDVADTAKRMQAGQDNLQQFLKLATDSERNGYQSLTNRDLATEVVKALAALGGEDEALKLVPLADRENMALALIHLHNKNDTDADANLRRMTNFLNDFPETKYRKKVLYDMAEIALNEGWRLTWENQRGNAASYLVKARDLFSGVVEDKQAGIEEIDVHESQTGMLRIYYAQRDWAGLSAQVAKMLTNAPPGGKDWLAIKLYDERRVGLPRKADRGERRTG